VYSSQLEIIIDLPFGFFPINNIISLFEPAAPGHSPDQFRLRWLRHILTGKFATSLVLFQKDPFDLPVSLSVVPAVPFDGFRLQFVPAGLNHCVSAQSSTVGIG